jgi:hypothetical protein
MMPDLNILINNYEDRKHPNVEIVRLGEISIRYDYLHHQVFAVNEYYHNVYVCLNFTYCGHSGNYDNQNVPGRYSGGTEMIILPGKEFYVNNDGSIDKRFDIKFNNDKMYTMIGHFIL